MRTLRPLLLPFFICSISGAFAQVDLQNGLIACYSFSGNANDGSGNHHDGTVEGATLASDRFGTPNNAYFFDGSDRIVIPSAPIVNNAELTISTWASVHQNPGFGAAQMVLTIGDNTYFYGQTLTHHYSSGDFTGWGIGGFNQNLTSVSYCTNLLPNVQTWYHLVLTIRLNVVTLYINGVKAGEAHTGGTPVYFYQRPSSVAYIGMRSSGIQGFRGTIDDVTIHNRVITAAEITELYQNGVACAAVVPSIPPPAPTVADITVCENDNATLTAAGGTVYRWYDASSNGNLIFEGNPFMVPRLKSTTSFYVASVGNGIESARKQVTVTVNPSPVLMCDIPNVGAISEKIVFTASGTSGTMPFSYNFDFGDGTLTSTPMSSQMHAYNAGQFQVKLAVHDFNGCKAECSGMILIEGELFIPNVITGNSDNLNHIFTIYTVHNNQYETYGGRSAFAMFIYNRWGEEVFYSEDPSAGWTGNGNSPGAYFYHIRLGEGRYKGWLSLLK